MDIERETIKTVPCPSGAPHTSDFNIVCVLKERQGAFKASIMLDNEISNKHTGLLKTRNSVYWERCINRQL